MKGIQVVDIYWLPLKDRHQITVFHLSSLRHSLGLVRIAPQWAVDSFWNRCSVSPACRGIAARPRFFVGELSVQGDSGIAYGAQEKTALIGGVISAVLEATTFRV